MTDDIITMMSTMIIVIAIINLTNPMTVSFKCDCSHYDHDDVNYGHCVNYEGHYDW